MRSRLVHVALLTGHEPFWTAVAERSGDTALGHTRKIRLYRCPSKAPPSLRSTGALQALAERLRFMSDSSARALTPCSRPVLSAHCSAPGWPPVMTPVRINIVYQNNNMPADQLAPIEVAEAQATVVWSRQPQPASDAIVYFNHYAYDRRLHDRIAPQALRVLYMYEPVAVDPIQYTRQVWEQFDAILTWNTYLTEQSDAFRFDPGIYYDLPYCSHYGIQALPDTLPDPVQRERAICQICGDKYSLTPEELYSTRRRIARWFHRQGRVRMDVFGHPPANVPNYRGRCESKAETFARYRYALCFENSHHPLWTRGYITEKLLDCMYALTIPVYLGASNIEALVPEGCFIDYRRFESLSALDAHLHAMSDETYLQYARSMMAFLKDYDAPRRHSAQRLYESAAALCRDRTTAPVERRFPPDYLDHSNLSAKLRFYVTRSVLPHYRHIYPLFSVIRRLGAMGRRR